MNLAKIQTLIGVVLTFSAVGHAADFHPITSVTTSATDYWPVSNLIQGPGTGFTSTEPHVQLGSGSGSRWVTDAPNGGTGDYFANGVADPVLIFDLGADRSLNEISTWGYADSNTNGAKNFTLRFASSVDGLVGFGTSISYNPSFEAAFSIEGRDSHEFSSIVTARYVEMRITDNWKNFQGGLGGGDRVGLGEVAFGDNVPNLNPIIEIASGLDLGSHPADPGIVTLPLTVRNLGTDQPLQIYSAMVQGGTPGASYFSVSDALVNIPAGSSADIQLSLNAAGNEGCFYALVKITTNDPLRPSVELRLAASINCTPEAPVEPVFSVDSGTFTGSFDLQLSTVTAGARIVFTTDGSAPSAINGMTYTGPIPISSSTQLRAATISGDLSPAIATENYVRLAADVAAYSSALPILIVENYAAGTIPNKGWSTNTQTGAGLQQLARQPAYMQIVDRDPNTDTASISTAPDLTSRIGIRVRGAFSSTWNQKPYSLETWKKNADSDRKVKPLGLPEDSDWILYYLHPDYDRTMLYNTFIWEVSAQTGRYGTRYRFVDVFVNENGGDLTMADRRGVYALAEKVKRGADRVDFDALAEDGSSGGWLLGINRMDAIPVGGFPAENGATSPQFFHTAGPNRIQQTPPNAAGQGDDIPRQSNAYINFEDPNGYRINTAQRAAIEDWFREFEDVFYDDKLWLDPVNGYRKYLDTRDFIDYFHLLNLAKQGDGLLISMFPWVSSGERKLHMGPMWDFNNGAYGSTTNSPLYYRKERLWYPRLFQDPSYQREYVDRWYELRRGPLSTANMDSVIDRQSSEITAGLAASQGASGWAGRLGTMKSNLANRAAWLDSQFFAPPEIGEAGGAVTLSDPSGTPGTIFYTLDGSDPQPVGSVTRTETILLDQGAAATAIIPSVANGGSTLTLSEWTTASPPPNSAAWLSGTTGIGFDYDGLVGLDVEAMKGINATAYARIPFTISDQESIDSWNALVLRMKVEDGFVAYINGSKVDEFNAPAAPDWQSGASSSHADSAAMQFLDFDISAHLGKLVVGQNMLAIHALNSGNGSSDLLALPQLVAAAISVSVPGARAYTVPIQLTNSSTIRARILSDSGGWSAINERTFIIGVAADASQLVVSEIMYHPVDPEVAAEFIELQNISATESIDLTQVAFTTGIDYVFPTGTTLAPGVRAVVTGADFRNGTRLANGGERIVLSAADGSPIKDFSYDDTAPWPEAADGGGFSLVLIAPGSNPDHGAASSWRRSADVGGSPGDSDVVEFAGDPAADDDRDGIPALLEHLFGSSDVVAGGSPISIGLAADGALLIEFPHDVGAEDVDFFFESSADLATWVAEPATLLKVNTALSPSEQWRLGPGDASRRFLRIRAEK